MSLRYIRCVLSKNGFGCGTIFVSEWMLSIAKQCIFTELEINVVKHVSLFSCDTFGDMHTVSGKTLQGKVLGTAPWLDCNT